MTAPAAALLEVDGVSKTFTARRGGLGRRVDIAALNDVDMRIEPGETVGLVGETGSGKSTLGRIILGLDSPTTGSVKFEGTSIGQMSRTQLKHLRRRMQVVFQDPYESLNPYMTVREILEEPFRVHDLYDSQDHPGAARRAAGCRRPAAGGAAADIGGVQRRSAAAAGHRPLADTRPGPAGRR